MNAWSEQIVNKEDDRTIKIASQSSVLVGDPVIIALASTVLRLRCLYRRHRPGAG